MVYRKLRIVTIILITAVVLSCICTALVRKFVFPPPKHEQEAAAPSLAPKVIIPALYDGKLSTASHTGNLLVEDES
jgi:hypothetical protein